MTMKKVLCGLMPNEPVLSGALKQRVAAALPSTLSMSVRPLTMLSMWAVILERECAVDVVGEIEHEDVRAGPPSATTCEGAAAKAAMERPVNSTALGVQEDVADMPSAFWILRKRTGTARHATCPLK